MNMFKKSKKAKDQDDGFMLSSEPPISKASRALTRKKKKQEVEEKPAFDLSSALPDSNEFRTSLLMPNLSARFSMLREQDDPNTKVGKASDDSVLFPRRSSRMNLFSNNALGDIAEVESIKSGFRPPFADENPGSFSDGYASDDGGSVMSRARPGEGNNLFGGRQKLYKVATGPAKDLSSTSLSSRKHVYDSDVSLSAFQQYRIREKDHHSEADEGADRSSYPVTDQDEQDSTRSPLTGFSRNRGTQSSTNSGPSNRRTSTAATSVVSESPLPQGTNHAISKVKEQDANSSAESIGFATSPGFRALSNEDSRAPYRLSGSRSVANIRENYSRQSPLPTYRAMSPPANAMSQLDFGLKDNKSPMSSPKPRTISPTAQFDFGQNSPLANNVNPNDRGKATAMGLFNKPARHYDDAQFQQRQMQMHEGRNSPSSVNSRAASRASPEPVRSGHQSYSSAHDRESRDGRYTQQIPPVPSYPPSPASNRRTSVNSAGRRSRAKSSASVREAVVKARVESLIRKQNAELAAREANELGPPRLNSVDQGMPDIEEKTHGGTFYDNSDYSDDEEQPIVTVAAPPRMPPPPPPPSGIHPALRSEVSTFNFGMIDQDQSHSHQSTYSATSRPGTSIEPSRRSQHESVFSVESNDSRSVPAAGLGLSGLIRTHLRQDSDKSSMMPPPSPVMLEADNFRGSVSSTARTVTESVKSDPFEYDNERQNVSVPAQDVEQPPTPTAFMGQRAQQILEQARAIRDAQIAEADASHFRVEPPTPVKATYGDEITASGHQRSESTETQREQRRFDEDLAERRKRIQEGLKSVQERSRSRSPIAERNPSTGHGFSLPRFPGRSNTGDRDEPAAHSKAMKMLGISGPKELVTSPRIRQDARPFEQERAHDNRYHPGPASPLPNDYDRHNGRHTPNSARPNLRNGDRPPPPRSTTPSNRRENRDRSNSAAAERSVSRNKHVPEFSPRAIPGAFPHSPNISSPPFESGQRSDSPATYDRSASRADQNERAGYFNSRGLAPPPESSQNTTPRPSPKPFSSADSAFQLQSGMPMSPPSSALPSPNPATNGRTTPTAIPGRATPSGSRKKSVTKNMISEPTFVSSTSTVPLVYLPKDGGPPVEAIIPPPVPAMNPRRRGTAPEEHFAPHPAVRPGAITPAESPRNFDFSNSSQPLAQPPTPRSRNKLRKSSSEGGNMAARARHHAFAAEMALEKDRSPNVAVFPNRSATSLARHEGGMF